MANGGTIEEWDQFLDIIMPVKPYELGDFPNLLSWEVKARIEESFVDPLMFTLRKYSSGNVEATVIRVQNDSQVDVYSKYFAYDSKMSVTKIADEIKLVHTKLDSNKCPALLDLAKELEDMPVKAVLPTVLYVDGTEYNILTENLWFNKLRIEYHGPGPDAKAQPVPVIDWVERLRRVVVQDCK